MGNAIVGWGIISHVWTTIIFIFFNHVCVLVVLHSIARTRVVAHTNTYVAPFLGGPPPALHLPLLRSLCCGVICCFSFCSCCLLLCFAFCCLLFVWLLSAPFVLLAAAFSLLSAGGFVPSLLQGNDIRVHGRLCADAERGHAFC